MYPLTAHLKEEHDLILEGIDVLDIMGDELESGERVPTGDLRAAVYALQGIVETCHHTKEEKVLFPALDASGRMSQGGPKCVQYMGQLLDNDLAGRILRENDGAEPLTLTPEALALSEKGSPLRIPLEEHQAGHLALLRLRLEIEAYEREPALAYRVATRIRQYTRLLRLHVEKENTCLFVLADQLLGANEQEQLLKDALALEQKFGPKGLQEQRALLARLKRDHAPAA